MKEFLPNIEVFEDLQSVTVKEILYSLENTTEVLSDFDYDVECLPILAFLEYLASDVLKSQVNLTKTRIWNAIVLAKIGRVGLSVDLMFKILKWKDSVIDGILLTHNSPIVSSRESSYLNQTEGNEFEFIEEKYKFHDYLPFENPKNSQTLELLMSEDLDICERHKVSSFLTQMMRYTRWVIICKLLKFKEVTSDTEEKFNYE